MSAEREAEIRDLWEQWNSGGRASIVGDLTDDFLLESAVTGRTFKGREGIVEWMAEIDESFEGWRLWIDEIREVRADRYLVLGGVHLRGRGSGVEFDQPIGWILDFDGDSLARLLNVAGHEAAIEAAGS
jgi:hypothetical protein